MDTQLRSHLHFWAKVDDLEIIPGDRIEQTLSRTTRKVPCMLKPANRRSLREVVRIARENRIPIYPISRGKNWGYGAHLPVRDDCVIVSLEKLRRIGPCVPEANKIYLEAGVSQLDLFEYLQQHHAELTFNVTAGGTDTSIIGNCLERGIGYHSSRADDLHGIEVLTMDGHILQQDSRLWNPSHPEGIGTGWEGLFFQSNYGIVLGGWFNLLPRQESTIFLSVQHPVLENLIADFKKLYRNNLLCDVTHIADPGRKHYMVRNLVLHRFPGMPEVQVEAVVKQVGTDDFQGVTAIHGKKSVCRATLKEIRKQLSPGSSLTAFTPKTIARLAKISRWIPIPKIRNLGIFLDALGELLVLSSGTPTNVGLLSLKIRDDNPNYADEIAVYLNATLPPRQNATQSLKALLDHHAYKHSITYIVNADQAVSSIITLHFAENEAAQVQIALEKLTRALIENGFPPYRAGIDQMAHLAMPEITRKLKAFFDPLHLIAPGRYT